MYTFPDPSNFEASVPPVPDIKAWLQEFRAEHPPSPNNAQNYEEQINSLSTRNDTMRMEFETMAISNKSISSEFDKIKQELFHSKSKIKHIEFENNRLQRDNKLQFTEIETLKQEIKQLQSKQHSQHTSNENIDTKQIEIEWNFDCVKNADNKDQNNNNNKKKSRKRPRADSSKRVLLPTGLQNTDNNNCMQHTKNNNNNNNKTNNNIKKAKLCTMQYADDPDNILDRRLPNNLDLIRGDILAEAGCDDQISFCFNNLAKCTTEDWQLRNFLMEMITGLCSEKKSISYSIIYESRHIIKKQLTDLRSTIVKTTCDMLIVFSKYSDKTKYGQSLSFFIPTHLQGLYVTISCIRDAHNQCLTQSINNTQSFKCINPLLKGLQNKHPEVRVKVIHLLSSLINTSQLINNFNMNNNNKKMDKYADAIGNTIKTYISDANANVRDAVKQLFESFAKQFPQRAKMLLSKVDVNSQKTLRKCVGINQDTKKTQYKRQTTSSSSNYGQSRTRRK